MLQGEEPSARNSPPVVQHAQQDVHHVGVCLLHLIKQHHGVGAPPAGRIVPFWVKRAEGLAVEEGRGAKMPQLLRAKRSSAARPVQAQRPQQHALESIGQLPPRLAPTNQHHLHTNTPTRAVSPQGTANHTPDCLGQLAAGLVPDVAGGRADEPRHAVLFHVLCAAQRRVRVVQYHQAMPLGGVCGPFQLREAGQAITAWLPGPWPVPLSRLLSSSHLTCQCG